MRRTSRTSRARAFLAVGILGLVLALGSPALAAITGSGLVIDTSGTGSYSSVDLGGRYAVGVKNGPDGGDIVAFDLEASPPVEIPVAATLADEQQPTVYGNRVVYAKVVAQGKHNLVADTIPPSTVPSPWAPDPTWDYIDPCLWEDVCVYARDDDLDGEHDIWYADLDMPLVQTPVSRAQGDEVAPSIWRDVVAWQHYAQTAGTWSVWIKLLGGSAISAPFVPGLTGDRIAPCVWGEWIVWEDHTSADYDIVAYSNTAREAIVFGHAGYFDLAPSVYGDRVVYTSVATDLSNVRVLVYDLTERTESAEVFETSGLSGAPQTSAFGEYVAWTTFDTAAFQAYVAQLDDQLVVEQLAGTSRYDTAVEISKAGWPGTSENVVIATGQRFPDALGGAALAGGLRGPVLLTRGDTLPASVGAELQRLSPARVYILGGVDAIGDGVQQEIERLLPAAVTERLEGADRYGTARAVANAALGTAHNVTKSAFVATGAKFADALAASPVASALGIPIYLAEPAGISPATVSAMQSASLWIEDVYLVGGEDVVSPVTEARLKDAFGTDRVHRISGLTRYDTAAEIARWAVEERPFIEYCGVTLANGQRYPDALTGGVLAGRRGTVMLLTHGASLTPATRTVLEEECVGTPRVTFFGGSGAIEPEVVTAVSDILR